MDVSVILQFSAGDESLKSFLPRLRAVLQQLHVSFEILAVNSGSAGNLNDLVTETEVRLVEDGDGYASGLLASFGQARGKYCLTLDADMSHEPGFIAKLWHSRHRGDIVVASRYVRGGVSYTSLSRKVLSRLLNQVFGRVLSIPVRDLSSGFRLYRREALKDLKLESKNLAALEEILVRLYARGFTIVELPFTYIPKRGNLSSRQPIQFAIDLARSAVKLWRLRNSIESADYDERAFYSVIPVQRFWQRRRHRIVTSWARGGGRILDAGCGSSLIIQSLNNAVGMDFNFAKVRFLRRYNVPVLRGSAFALPFKDGAFDCVISSHIIEHIKFDEVLFSEMCRVLSPGGKLIIGTPAYATVGWRIIEPLYGFVLPGGSHD